MEQHSGVSQTWAAVAGYVGIYEVSDCGAVRSLPRRDARGHVRKAQEMSVRVNSKGYPVVALCKLGKKQNHQVHQLVLESFEGPRPDGAVACHGDGNPSNNHVNNLRWDTVAGNARDRVAHGKDAQARKTHCPRGHALGAPNIAAGQVKRGRRVCLACTRERSSAWHQNRAFDVVRADRLYSEIMGHALKRPGERHEQL